MAKQVQGSCNRCGHCGCYEGAGGPAKWYPGIGGSKMGWGRQHPGQDLDICALIRTAFLAKFGSEWVNEYGFVVTIQIVGGGPLITVNCYVTERGIQASATDASCPFFESIVNATITGTTFTATTVTGSSTAGSVIGNLAVASGSSVGIVSNVAPNALTVYGWLGGTPIDGESVEVRENECLIWGRLQWPSSCDNNPQTFTEPDRIAKWELDHPHTSAGGPCGWEWVEV